MQEVVSGAVLGNGGALNPKGISSSWDNLEEILRKAVREKGISGEKVGSENGEQIKKKGKRKKNLPK